MSIDCNNSLYRMKWIDHCINNREEYPALVIDNRIYR